MKGIRAIDKIDRIGLNGVEDLLKKERLDASGSVTKGANLSDTQASEILNFELFVQKKLLCNFLSIHFVHF